MIVLSQLATVSETLVGGMAYHEPEKHRKAFEASHTKVFLYNADKLVGFGRALSDCAYQAAVYDCAVAVEYQGKGLGRMLMENILSRLQDCNVILYASPGRRLHEKLDFRKMRLGWQIYKVNQCNNGVHRVTTE
jgi:ribosomal protein S18 acetylase RimI-like enzyme